MEVKENYQQMWRQVESIISEQREKLYETAFQMMDETYRQVASILVQSEKDGGEMIDFVKPHLGIQSRTFYNLYTSQATGRLQNLLEGDYRISYALEFANVRRLNIDIFRQRFPKAFTPWKKSDDLALERMYCEGRSIDEMAAHFQRNRGGISARIEKLELPEKYAPLPEDESSGPDENPQQADASLQ